MNHSSGSDSLAVILRFCEIATTQTSLRNFRLSRDVDRSLTVVCDSASDRF